MATAKGYNAGRVFLQVIPSYDRFMTSLRRDTPALAKAFAEQLKGNLDKEGAKVGESLGKSVSDGVKKRLDQDDFSRTVEKQIAGVEKALGRVHRPMRDMQKDFQQGKITASQLTSEMAKLGNEFRRNANSIGHMDAAQRHNNRSAADAILGQERLAKATREVDRDTNVAARAINRIRDALSGSKNDSQDGANAFRFFNFAILAAASVGVTLIPILAAIGAGAIALGPIFAGLGAGLGVAILGFSGLGDAVKALGAQQDATGKSSGAYARAVQNAARGVADAQRGLQDAHRSAAEGIRRALESQRNAERNLADAQRDAKKAQQDLTQARKQAKEELKSLDDQVKQNALDERNAVIDLFNANMKYGAVMSDGGSTNLEKEQADIGLEQAQLNIKRIRDEEKRLAEDKAKADKGGVNGTDTVQRAEERLTDALDRQKEARRALGEAARQVDRARADGARQVADAQRNLTRAQEDYNYALQGGAEAADKVALAMSKLSPAGQAFARYLHSLRDNFIALRNVAQEGMLPGVEDMLRRMIRVYGPGMTGFVDEMSRALGGLFKQAGITFTSPVWRQFFNSMREASVGFVKDFGEGMLDSLTGMASLMNTALPYAQRLSTAIRGMFGDFKDWATSAEGTAEFKRFLEYAAGAAPKVKDLFVAILKTIVNLGVALAPVATSVMSFLTDLFNWLGKMDPDKLRAIAVGFGVLIVALQASSGIVAAISLIGAIAGAPFLVIAAAVIALGTAFFFLSRSGGENKKTFDKFRKTLAPIVKIFKEIFGLVKDKLVGVFRDDLMPALNDIGNAIAKHLLPSFERFWPVLRPLVKFLLFIFGEVLGGVIDGIKHIVVGLLKVLGGLMDFITGIFTGDWGLAWQGIKKIFSGIVQAIWGLVNLYFFGKILGGLKGLFTKILPGVLRGAGKGILNAATWPFRAALEFFTPWIARFLKGITRLRDGVKAGLEAMGKFFGKYLGKPVMAVVDFAINKGLIAGVNNIGKWLGLGGSDKKLLGNLPIHKFATGGIMPGYAPGIDRHQIMVGGGEAILRPEVTKALGHDEIHSWNRAAIRGGIGGVENVLGRNMRRYATGGIVWPTNTKALSGDYKGHTGVDIRAGYGAPVFAAHAGRVFATPRLGYSYGHHVKIAGTDGIQTIYAHLSRILTKVGANVKAGTRIGNVGSTGNSSGPHLHFEVRPGQTRSAALKYLNNGTIPKGGGTNSLLDSLSGAAKSAIKNPVKYLQNLVGDGFKKVPLSGEAMSLMKAVPKKFYSSIAEKLKKAAMKALDIGKGFFNLSPAGMAAKGVKALIGGRGPTPKLYDQGGYLPPGLSTVINRTGKPEPVFSPDQWAKMSAGGSGFVQNNHFTTKPLSADELVDQLAFEGRRAKRSGTVSRKGNK